MVSIATRTTSRVPKEFIIYKLAAYVNGARSQVCDNELLPFNVLISSVLRLEVLLLTRQRRTHSTVILPSGCTGCGPLLAD